ncbi:MAG TPA: DUF929 family protein [Actinomycetota bacterium]|nr:DUF929 family protein [Actinomycetota bacterium]
MSKRKKRPVRRPPSGSTPGDTTRTGTKQTGTKGAGTKGAGTKTAGAKPTSKRRPPPRGARRGLLPRWAPWVGIAVVVGAIGIALLLRNTSSASATKPASGQVTSAISSVPAATFDAVGVPSGLAAPKPLPSGTPAVEADGLPLVLYVGAEYCPYCAAERWPLAVALSRFGSFSDLSVTESAGFPEVYPHTPTLSFHGASYTSPHLAFQGLETATNKLGITGYGQLDTLTPEQQRLVQTYDAPPYVTTKGGIPFVLIGNRYVFNGAQYLPDVLRGKSAEQIAAELADPQSGVSAAVVGSANLLTAAICQITGQAPKDVCTSSAVTAAAKDLGS